MAKSDGGIVSEAWKGVAGAAAVGVFAWVMDWVKPAWGYILSLLASLVAHLKATSSWPNWMAYFMASSLAFVAFRSALNHWRNRKDNHKRFTKLEFVGAVWRWEFGFMSDTPENLQVFCPLCDARLVYENVYPSPGPDRVEWSCEGCHQTWVRQPGNRTYLDARVNREIDRLIRTGKWRSYVDKT